MLFKVSETPLFEENPELNSVPEFVGKSERMLKYVFLVYDYDSPYRKIPFEQRKNKCIIVAGYKLESDGKRLDKNAREIVSGANATVAQITKVFMELQGNPEKDTLAAYDAQICEWKELMQKKNKTDKEREYVLKVMSKLPEFMNKRKELLSIIGDISSDTQLEEISRPMSTLDEVNSEEVD